MRKLLLLLPVMWVLGCATFETNTYRVLAVTAHTVDATMNGWGDYVRAGKASAEQETAVKNSFHHYQATMQVAEAMVGSYRASGDRAAVSRALDVLDAAKNSLIDLVYSFKQ